MDYHCGFTNYPLFLEQIQQAMADERAAAKMYRMMMDLAPDDFSRRQVQFALEDEQKHYQMLHHLFVQLTGREPVVQDKPVHVTNFCEGLRDAFNDELGAMDMYRDMMLSTYISWVRDIFFVLMTDEMEHATRFSFVNGHARC